ncbi:unnamed protein product, partial [Mesorhabditis belari]|uniref:Uncharacterized protein n=1 Tax=Mesorhabditis belari TaxID=2138241 RepID=A0AAF3J3S1_9BILA
MTNHQSPSYEILNLTSSNLPNYGLERLLELPVLVLERKKNPSLWTISDAQQQEHFQVLKTLLTKRKCPWSHHNDEIRIVDREQNEFLKVPVSTTSQYEKNPVSEFGNVVYQKDNGLIRLVNALDGSPQFKIVQTNGSISHEIFELKTMDDRVIGSYVKIRLERPGNPWKNPPYVTHRWRIEMPAEFDLTQRLRLVMAIYVLDYRSHYLSLPQMICCGIIFIIVVVPLAFFKGKFYRRFL